MNGSKTRGVGGDRERTLTNGQKRSGKTKNVSDRPINVINLWKFRGFRSRSSDMPRRWDRTIGRPAARCLGFVLQMSTTFGVTCPWEKVNAEWRSEAGSGTGRHKLAAASERVHTHSEHRTRWIIPIRSALSVGRGGVRGANWVADETDSILRHAFYFWRLWRIIVFHRVSQYWEDVMVFYFRLGRNGFRIKS